MSNLCHVPSPLFRILPRSCFFFFLSFSEKFSELGLYFCFSNQKAEAQRGLMIFLRSHSSKVLNKKLNWDAYDIKAHALSLCLLNNTEPMQEGSLSASEVFWLGTPIISPLTFHCRSFSIISAVPGVRWASKHPSLAEEILPVNKVFS